MLPGKEPLQKRAHHWPLVAAGLVLACLCFLPAHHSQAMYEIPYVDSSATAVKADFRGIWSYNLGTNGHGAPVNEFQAFAVGSDPLAADPENSGLLMQYTGNVWKNIPSPIRERTSSHAVLPTFPINAIVGQGDLGYGTPSGMIMVGTKGRIVESLDYTGAFPGVLNGGMFFPVRTAPRAGETRAFYAVDAAQVYRYPYLAGGQTDGTAPIFATGNIDNTVNYSPVNGANATLGTTGIIDPARENIVGIRYIDAENAYILTSTFVLNDRYNSFGRNSILCNTQTGRLYFVNASKGLRNFYLVATIPSVCTYGLAVGKRDTGSVTGLLSATDTRFPHVIWIATSKGLYTIDELDNQNNGRALRAFTTPATRALGESAAPLFSVTAVRDVGGQGVNLMTNGTFDVWSGPNPESWVVIPARYYGLENGVGPCTANLGAVFKRINGANPYVEVATPKMYATRDGSGNCTGAPATNDTEAPMGVIGNVELPPAEGQMVKVSGRYKVEFVTPEGYTPTNANFPAHAEGGVALGCGGNDQPMSHARVDCTFSYRQLMRTYSKAAGDQPGINQATSGWTDFSVTLSRQDLNLANYEGTPIVSPRRFDLVVRCEGTYGARVSCDNLKVEELVTPQVPPRDTYYVVGVGQGRTLVANDDALGVGSKFQAESQPNVTTAAFRLDYQGVFGSGLQHIYTVGAGINTEGATAGQPNGEWAGTLATRAPTTLKGYIWVGTTDAGLNNVVVGKTGRISTSCLNDYDPITQQSLCQRSSESYGISLNITKGTASTPDTGLVQGRGWFGRDVDTSFADQEQVSVGTCSRPPTYTIDATQPYKLAGVSAGTGMCNTTFRRCKANAAGTALTANSCISDFNCFGRCTNDGGRICINDGDCRIDATTSTAVVNQYISTELKQRPSYFLTCTKDSPQSCSSFGWLSFDAADFPGATTAPDGGALGVRYNARTPLHNAGYCLNDQTVPCAVDADCGAGNTCQLTGNNAGAHELTGWARFKTLGVASGFCNSDTSLACSTNADCSSVGGLCNLNFSAAHGQGWVQLRGNESVASTSNAKMIDGAPYLYGCQDCYGSTLGTVQCAFCTDRRKESCIPPESRGTSTNATCSKLCKTDSRTRCMSDTDCINATHPTVPSGTCTAPGVCSGDETTLCWDSTGCAGNGTCRTGLICKTSVTVGANTYMGMCAAYGVNISQQTGRYFGYAWSQDFGWLGFSGVSPAGARFIQTKLGDIAAGGDVGDVNFTQPQGVNNCNATFLILAGRTIASNWCSALGINNTSVTAIQPYSGTYVLPNSTTYYANALGRIDVVGITKNVKTGGNPPQNKYGSSVVALQVNADGSHPTDIAHSLNEKLATTGGTLSGRVFTVDCPTIDAQKFCTIDESINILNSNQLTVNGGGVLYVNGDLRIYSRMAYDPTNVALDPREVASLTVIVNGNVQVESHVDQIIGAYYLLPGSGSVKTQFSSTTTPSVSQTDANSLKVYGLIMAQSFVFGRNVAGTVDNPEPSELIIFDGRLQTNPLPGLTDFAKILPTQVSQP